MAEVVLGMWTTHGPTLSTTPEQWPLRLPADHRRTDHPFRGGLYDFESLVALRRDENLGAQATLEERTRRAEACQKAIGVMADAFAASGADVAVIMGNDQKEMFLDDLLPAITVFRGASVWNQPATDAQAARMPPGIHEAEAGHNPPEYTEYPGLPELGLHIARSVTADQFDIASSERLPRHEEHWAHGVSHAFGFVYRQIMRDKVVPHVPIILNTFFPPNQPTARRCFDFGRAVGRAIRSWDSDKKVAVFGSGGMSHFVIDEAFDRMFLKAIAERDGETLSRIDEHLLQSGTSELKTWIAAAGILFDTPLQGGLVDYQPCYRSEAGTGTANGFVYWSAP